MGHRCYGERLMMTWWRSLSAGMVTGACLVIAACGSPPSTAPPVLPQTTTTFGPTTTIDWDALNATWPLSGNWLIHEPGGGGDGAEHHGFAGFSVQVNGDRLVSTGHGQCFLFGGRAVVTDGVTKVVPIEGASTPAVECDPGPASDVYSAAVECLETGCRLDLQANVLHLSTPAGDAVADLVRTAGDIP